MGFKATLRPFEILSRLRQRVRELEKADSSRYVWLIWVSGCGTCEFIGTEAQAEEFRANSANLLQGVAQKFCLRYSPGVRAW